MITVGLLLPNGDMYEIFKTSIAQMGAVGLLLAFAGMVIYWMRDEIRRKDERILAEIQKREDLLREVLKSHQDSLEAMRATTESLRLVMDRIENTADRIEDKIDDRGNERKNQEPGR